MEILRHVSSGTDSGEFFGSLYDIEGYRQYGYQPGCRILARIGITDLKELAVLEDACSLMLSTLKEWKE